MAQRSNNRNNPKDFDVKSYFESPKNQSSLKEPKGDMNWAAEKPFNPDEREEDDKGLSLPLGLSKNRPWEDTDHENDFNEWKNELSPEPPMDEWQKEKEDSDFNKWESELRENQGGEASQPEGSTSDAGIPQEEPPIGTPVSEGAGTSAAGGEAASLGGAGGGAASLGADTALGATEAAGAAAGAEMAGVAAGGAATGAEAGAGLLAVILNPEVILVLIIIVILLLFLGSTFGFNPNSGNLTPTTADASESGTTAGICATLPKPDPSSSAGFAKIPNKGTGFDDVSGEGYWGTPEIIALLEGVSSEYNKQHPKTIVQINDISLKNGGYYSPHHSHTVGIDVDINSNSNNPNFIMDHSPYDPELAVDLGKKLMDTGAIVYIFYNDTNVQAKVNAYAKSKNLPGVMQSLEGHSNHFHVRIDPSLYDKTCNYTETVAGKAGDAWLKSHGQDGG